MRQLVAALMLVTASLGAVHPRPATSARRSKIVVETGGPSSPFDCDTPKAREWYGSVRRCLDDRCLGRNEINEHVEGPDGSLRKNPCYYPLRQ